MERPDLTDRERALLEQAREAAKAAYCPYSNFPVGAAAETDRGVFVGCNVENASYGLAICAERVALFTAIAAGARRITQLAVSCIAAGPGDPPGSRMPCGACRQVIAEFMTPESVVIVDGAGVWRVADLLPEAFQLTEQPFLKPSP
jgi:cytidine deaminase